MKHTQGKWTLESPCGFPYSGLYVVPVIRKDFPCYIAQVRQLRERKESEANAHLIAAAPDLLDACKAAQIMLLQTNWNGDKRLNIVHNAITKAQQADEPERITDGDNRRKR